MGHRRNLTMLQAVVDILRRRGIEGWLVGGSVRDRELGRPSPDLDVVVATDPASVAAETAAVLRAPWFILSDRHPAWRVMGRDGHVDVSALRGSGIHDDLAGRDFTINAMALPLGGEGTGSDARQLIDPFGGRTHLAEQRLVAVSDHVFSDDPLRLMRAVRFSHVLGFGLDASLAGAIRQQAAELRRAAAERVTAEMALTLGVGKAADAVRGWHRLGLLAVLLPEVTSVAGRLEWCLALLERLDSMLARPAAHFLPAAEALEQRLALPVDGAVTRPVALRLAGLTCHLEPDDAEAVGRRWRLSADAICLLATASRHLAQASGREHTLLPEARALRRPEVLFLWGAAPFEPEVIMLAAAAGLGVDTERQGVAPGVAARIMALWADRAVRGVRRPPLDGESVMRELGLESGPLLGRVLREVRLAWEAGEAVTVPELLDVARRTAAV